MYNKENLLPATATLENSVIEKLNNTITHVTNKRVINKLSRQAGLSYETSRGEVISSKTFTFKECNCLFNCKTKLKKEIREDIFQKFWGLANWNAQSAFLKASVKQV